MPNLSFFIHIDGKSSVFTAHTAYSDTHNRNTILIDNQFCMLVIYKQKNTY